LREKILTLNLINTMKKLLSFSFIIILIFILTSCGKPDTTEDVTKTTPQVEISNNEKNEQEKETKEEVSKELEKTIDNVSSEDTEKNTENTEKDTEEEKDTPKEPETKDEEPMLVGNDKDEHGCVWTAGYTWNEEKQECTRSWEDEKEEETKDETKEEIEAVEPIIQKTLLILDGSGSMWGKLEDKSKIEIAREVIKKTIKTFDDSIEIWLMAYGHRRMWDCKDIEILVEPKKGNSDTIAKLVDTITPTWMTPMGNSVMMAAESMQYTEQKATVILVSDGIETCDVDLCALGKKLEESGIDFTAHVIGFDMTEEQSAGLKCLANETGGEFMLAKDADSLGEAIGKAVEASACSVEKLGEATVSAPKTVAAGSKFEVQYTWPNNTSDHIIIVPKGKVSWNDHISSTIRADKDKHEMIAPDALAEYDILYFAHCGTPLWKTSITVTAVTAEITKTPTNVAAGSKFEIDWTWPNNTGDRIMILPKGSIDSNEKFDRLFTERNGREMTAPETIAEYDIVYMTHGGTILARTSFTVGEVSATITKSPTTVDAGSTFEVEWTWPNNSGDFIMILPKGSTSRNDHLERLHANRDTLEMTAPETVAEYDIVYMTSEQNILTKTSFTVSPVYAEITKFPESVNIGSDFEVEWTWPNNAGDFIMILPKGSTSRNDHLERLHANRDTLEMTAPKAIGEYDIIYMTSEQNILARETFIVTQ